MYVIGHEMFNKSLTLDIENRLMQYLLSVDNISRVHNSRTNQQNEYYTSEKLDEIFSDIWGTLNKKNKVLFPIESIIKDSAIFKASPFHKLTQEQINAKEEILNKIKESIILDEEGQLLIVEGEAGSGKTVLMSTLLYELKKYNLNLDKDLDIHLLVNHNEHVTIYNQIATKLGITNKKKNIINKPTSFINSHSPDEKVDVVIVDEAHLLLTQGKQSYRGKNHLQDLLERAKVVVIVFDIKQILTTEQIWDVEKLNDYFECAKNKNNHVTLKNQMRINSDEKTVKWIRNLIDNKKINDIPRDKKGYDIKIFDSPEELESCIREKAQNTDSGISRMLATFDWQYNNKPPENEDFWRVKVGNWSMPWNYQIKVSRKQKNLPWVEQDQTIDEIGSTYTIQGLDLNYAGVIIGPSVKYRNGEIVFDEKSSANKKATRRRTLEDGSKQHFSQMLLKNELNVLLTRGVNGLYIYAVDEQLREALKKASKGDNNG
ncbi:DNA/RNA helicase domain-containing protein [Mammaliicoccus sciuri]|nr:DNA/RNA helicase domain-containing protein [Mammaliicoccus sciuri]